jgi:hypothetical protein
MLILLTLRRPHHRYIAARRLRDYGTCVRVIRSHVPFNPILVFSIYSPLVTLERKVRPLCMISKKSRLQRPVCSFCGSQNVKRVHNETKSAIATNLRNVSPYGICFT